MPQTPLLSLPPELREIIWIHTVTEWEPTAITEGKMLEKSPIRHDLSGRPPLPPITMVSKQTRRETLQRYYEENIFEFWRPVFWQKQDWHNNSIFLDFLRSIGPLRRSWLRDVVLMYKHEGEMRFDVERELLQQGLPLGEGVIKHRRHLTELEEFHESYGLPRQFGRMSRNDRWQVAQRLL